jgi:hypothetical protein
MHAYCRAVKGKEGEAVLETELHSELQRLKSQMKAIDASIAAARSQLENLKREDERTVWETNIVILKASAACMLPLWSFSMLELPEMMITPLDRSR